MERSELKQYIIENYPNAKEGDQMGIMNDMIRDLNDHCKIEVVQSVIFEINNPPPPTEEELDKMLVAELDVVASNIKWISTPIEGYSDMLKADKLYAIKVSLGYIIPEIPNEEDFEEPLNEE